MTQLTRIGSYLILLLGLLLGAVLMNNWLQRQTQAQVRQLNEAAIALKRQQFRQLADKMHFDQRTPPAELADAARTMGVTVERYENIPILPSAGTLWFEESLGAGASVHVSFPPPPATRLLTIYHRITLSLLVLCPALLFVGLLLAFLVRRLRTEDRGATRTPWATAQAQAVGMEQFARLSHERTVALAAEHAARSRAEEDLQVNRSLLGSSVAERVRLGRELHDNICQTLYAVCLTLESVQKKSGLTPEMSQRTDQCLAELRRVNQEVRAYLQELEPGRVNGHSFATALAGLIGSLPADDEVRIERRLDAATVELIPSHQVAEIMNILREAVSNSLRHGRARNIVLRAGQNDQAIALSVQDDGRGFATGGERSGGHGLANMQARARALGANLKVESTPGKGTLVILNLPISHPA